MAGKENFGYYDENGVDKKAHDKWEDCSVTGAHYVKFKSKEERDAFENEGKNPIETQKGEKTVNKTEKTIDYKSIGDKSEESANIEVIPTLYMVNTGTCKGESDKVTFGLKRLLEGWELKEALENKYIFAASLFTATSTTKSTMTYKDNNNNKIEFNLPKNDVHVCLIFEYADKKDGEDLEINGDVIAVIKAMNTKNTKNKGSVTYNMNLDEYNQMASYEKVYTKDDNKLAKFYFDDKTYIFKCRTEKIPVPGKDDGMFAFVDGSSTKTPNAEPGYEELYGAGYIINYNKELYSGHTEGKSSSANDIGEIEAATLVIEELKRLLEKHKEKQEIRIYYDNQKVGYYPTGLNDANTDHGKAYITSVNELAKALPKDSQIVFCHLDAHKGIYGNEMADQLAQVNKENGKLKDCTENFETQRKKIFENGSHSEAVRLSIE